MPTLPLEFDLTVILEDVDNAVAAVTKIKHPVVPGCEDICRSCVVWQAANRMFPGHTIVVAYNTMSVSVAPVEATFQGHRNFRVLEVANMESLTQVIAPDYHKSEVVEAMKAQLPQTFHFRC